jgi:hypothetical protein
MPATTTRRAEISAARRVAHLVRVVLAGFMLVMLAAPPADAHVRSTTGYTVIRSNDSDVTFELSLEYEMLARSAGLGTQAVNADHDSARQTALDDGREALAAYLAERIDIYVDDVACRQSLVHAAPRVRDGLAHAVLDLSFDCPGSPTGSHRIDYTVFADSEGVVDDHVNIVDYDLGGERGRVILDAGHSSFVVGDRSVVSSTARFAGLGVEHILAGLDHVLFLVALLLGATSLRSVAAVVSMFTLAHSATLALAVLGRVSVPAEIVEPLIALSIVYVAAENLLGGRSRHRLAVVFGFGLLHGLGFAGALRFTDELSWGLVGSLVGFNVGIEAGQVLIVAVLFPVLIAIRRYRWSGPVQLGATGAIGLAGLVWFVQRVALG